LVKLFDENRMFENRHSSKGNQLKWRSENIWYKADYTGYEGIVEYLISKLLIKSNIQDFDFVDYDTEVIEYGVNKFLGCKSENFLSHGWNLITLERLFKQMKNISLQQCIFNIENHEKRIEYLVNETIRMTGLKDFGKYMSTLLTIDAFFLNEDRHTHNIAVLWDGENGFKYCPIFDNGSSLLSDITMDYPMNGDHIVMTQSVRGKTFCSDLDEQLEIAEKLYGQYVKFDFSIKDVEELLYKEPYYDQKIKERISDILRIQLRKYRYLF